ncbi:unnamed protein product [Ectocarpus sp. 6 AP-2014]
MHPASAVGRTADTHSLRAARQLYGGDPVSDQCPAGSVANIPPCYYYNQREAGVNQPRAIKKRRRRPRSKSKFCRNEDDAKHYASGGAGNQAVPRTEPRSAALQVADDKVHTRSDGHFSKGQLKAKNECSARDAGASIARSSTPRTNECTARVGPVRGSARRKTRIGRGKKFPRSGQEVSKKMMSTLSQRELNMQMRLLSPGEQGIIDHVLETFAAQVDGKSMRTRDFFNLMDSNRDNVLTRSELKEALVNRQLVLRDDQLTHLMAFLDVHGHGYVTLGDLHDGLRTFRAARHRTKIHGQSTRLPRPQPRPPPDSIAVTRLQSALLAPLTLFSAQAPVEGQGKHQRYTKNASEKRILEQEAGINFLDITDPEISSLADFLMDAEKAGGRPHGGLPSTPADHIPTTDAQQSKALRPLPLIMAALESTASRAPGCINRDGQQTGGIRGPGAAAVPCSAARVLWILRGLQRVWRQKDRRRKAKTLIQESADEFTDEKLSVAVSLFDVDGQGHIDLQDVMTVFRNARVDKFVRGRLPAAAIPSLVAIGRHLESRKITAHDFVQDAATSTIVDSSEPSEQPRDPKPTPKRKRDAKRDQTQTATTAQLGALLFSELQLDAEQRNLVLECIEEDGLVSGANVAGAVRRARGELAHRKLERLEQQQGMVDGGPCWSSETGSQVSELSGSTCSIISPPRFRPQAGAAPTAEEGMLAPLQHKHQRDGFNQSDASSILGLFVKEGGGLRNLTGKSAAGLWRGLKRRGRGVHAYEDGRSAARRLQQLLGSRDMKPLRWFATLDPMAESSAPSDEGSSMERHVAMSSIIQGVQALGGTTRTGPPGEANTVHTASDGEGATDSLEGTLSSNDGSYSSTAQSAGKNYKAQRWTKAQLSALARHLDPCGEGSITQEVFQEGLCVCRGDRGAYPDAAHLAAARRLEDALRDDGCRDVCGMFHSLAGEGRGGGDLVEYIRQMGDYSKRSARELEAAVRQERMGRALLERETEAQRISTHKSALCERVSRPENACALRTIQKLDELMSLQGRRLVVEFHQADTNRSGGVDPTELKKVMKNLVQPCSLLRFERKRRRERQEAAAATSHNAERWKGDFMEKMEALDKSKASNFLDIISTALRNRRWQIRDVFRDVDKGKSGALGVNDLLENTHLALGLKLDRGEATALVSMLDTNGDKSIQCEELELALRLYRRYGWERHRWSRRKPFHEEFPSLSCLFRRTPRAEGGGAGLQQQQRNPALPRDTKVNRGDIVTALVRLRGGSSGGAAGGNRGRGKLLPAHGPNVQRRRVLLRAVRKVAHCCQTAGVRTAPALLATLAYFDFGPVDEARRKAGGMRAVDLWHWLRLLSAPAEDSGGSVVGGSCNNNANRTKGVHGQRRKKDVLCGRNKSIYGFGDGGGGRGGAHKTVDEMVSGRLLDAEETALLLDALELRTRVQEARDAPATGATEDGPIVSVPAFWDLLVEHVPGLWDRELQERLEAEEVERQAQALRSRQSAAALTIQGAARQRQASHIPFLVRDERAAAEEKAKAATTVQKAVRRQQASECAWPHNTHFLHQKQVRLDRIKSNKAVTRIQAMERGRIARHHAAAERAAKTAAAAKAQAEAQAKAELEESARRLAAATEERNAARATVKIQCATRQRHAREEVSRRRRRQQEEAARLAAAAKIQSVARGRQARTAAEEELSRRREEAARLAAAVKIQSVARGRLARTAAEEELNQRQKEAARLAAAIKIQSVARGRLTREEAKEAFRRQQKEEARLVAVVKIQSVVRGWLARESAKEAAEIAALDAAIAARQAKMTEEALPGAGAADQGRGGWRKKSVVGARGVQGLAGLQVQLPPNDNAA